MIPSSICVKSLSYLGGFFSTRKMIFNLISLPLSWLGVLVQCVPVIVTIRRPRYAYSHCPLLSWMRLWRLGYYMCKSITGHPNLISPGTHLSELGMNWPGYTYPRVASLSTSEQTSPVNSTTRGSTRQGIMVRATNISLDAALRTSIETHNTMLSHTCNRCRTLIRSAVTPMAVTSPPALYTSSQHRTSRCDIRVRKI